MNDRRVDILMQLLRSVIAGEDLSKHDFTEEVITEVYQLAKKHDLSHLLYEPLLKYDLLRDNEFGRKIKNSFYQALWRYEQLDYEFRRISETFENAKIPFIPLKGSVIRHYYPQPWMRTSIDIDILIHIDDITKASEVLTSELNYRRDHEGSHDVSFYASNEVHLELHTILLEARRYPKAGDILINVWDHVKPCKDMTYCCCLSNELFYFYHIAHMVKHFENGGCGIRPFIDLWIMRNNMEFNSHMLDGLLQDGGFLQFADKAVALSEKWMSGLNDPTVKALEEFVLTGGAYGNLENRVIMGQIKKGSKFKYLLSKIFVPYRTLKFKYPILRKHKWLLPICEVCRWVGLLFGGSARRSYGELSLNNQIAGGMIEKTSALRKQVGL